MPLLDESKLLSCFLSGNGCNSSTIDNTITSNSIKYKDLRKLVIPNENIIEEWKGKCLYGSGGTTRQKKRIRIDDDDDDDDDDEKKELATQAKHAKLFEYYNLYNTMKKNDYVSD